MDTLARAEAELLRVRVSCQPQLLNKPLTMLQQLDQACRDVLPERNFREKYEYQLQTLNMALQQAIQDNDVRNLKEIAELTVDITGQLYESMKADPALARVARKKKEIVFVPYKAAMWDSLESIWMAAAADTEHCHVQVVPIPYADRYPDGTAKEWHYEIDLFPDYVPVVNCDEIDLEALHPDVIFFHYPYDNCNRVTSVDSRFYSDKLRRYTDKLVYVPYFVTGGKAISDHFCQTPGVFYADHVICESEAIKEIYEKNHRAVAPVPEGKILALGSPKYDKVMMAKKEDYPIPEEWNKIINGRKVILYNTSLTAQLQNPQHIISKLQSVLQYFKEKKDIAFWWRPHPLIEATFDSMLPHIADVYRQIRDKYIAEGWGIYDNTQELDRAIAWSDLYYGDGSSVLNLYEITGKPILVQSFVEKPSYSFLGPYSTLIVKNKLYFVSRYICCLGELKLDTGEILWHSINYKCKTTFADSFSGINLLPNGSLLLAPVSADHFLEYDLKSHSCHEVADMCNLPKEIKYKFWHGIEYKNKIFYYGFSRMSVVVYEKDVGKFRYIERSFELRFPTSEIDEWNHYVGTVVRQHLLIVVRNTQYIVDLDMETERVSLINLVDHVKIGSEKLLYIDSNDTWVAVHLESNRVLLWKYGTEEWNNVVIPEKILSASTEEIAILMGERQIYFVSMNKIGDSNVDCIYMSLSLLNWQLSQIKTLLGVKALCGYEHKDKETFYLYVFGDSKDYIVEYDFYQDELRNRYSLDISGIPDDSFVIDRIGQMPLYEGPGILEKVIDLLPMLHGDDEVYTQKKVGEKIYQTVMNMNN